MENSTKNAIFINLLLLGNAVFIAAVILMPSERELLVLNSVVLTVISSLIAAFLYWIGIYKGGLAWQLQSRLMGNKSADKRQFTKIQKTIEKDIQDLVVNADPQLSHVFPGTLELAKDQPQLSPTIASALTQVLGTILLRGTASLTPQTESLSGVLRATNTEQTLIKSAVEGLLNWSSRSKTTAVEEKKPKHGRSDAVI